LFPNPGEPNLGVFVGNQTRALAARPGVEVRVINPLPIPPWPLSLHPHYRALTGLAPREAWHGIEVARPRMAVVPGLSAVLNALMRRAVRPIMRRWWDEGFRFDVIDAEFFFPDGPAAVELAREFGVPCSIKARGADIDYWGMRPDSRAQVRRAGRMADGMLAVCASLKRTMVRHGHAGGAHPGPLHRLRPVPLPSGGSRGGQGGAGRRRAAGDQPGRADPAQGPRPGDRGDAGPARRHAAGGGRRAGRGAAAAADRHPRPGRAGAACSATAHTRSCPACSPPPT
jgi:hypothetical protein